MESPVISVGYPQAVGGVNPRAVGGVLPAYGIIFYGQLGAQTYKY